MNGYNSADRCITVVDSSRFFRHLQTDERLRDTDLAVGMETDVPTSLLLVNHVESADIILLTNTDRLDEKEVQTVKAAIEALNTRARVIPGACSKVCQPCSIISLSLLL